jgi:hypothetical protein
MPEAGTSRSTDFLATTEDLRSFPSPIRFRYPFRKCLLCCCLQPLLLHYECQSRELRPERLSHSGFTVPLPTTRRRMLQCSTQRQASALPGCPEISFCVASPVAVPSGLHRYPQFGRANLDLSSRNSDILSAAGHLQVLEGVNTRRDICFWKRSHDLIQEMPAAPAISALKEILRFRGLPRLT